jgi:prepilin-type N-terminal cleavage/methylation domain-containing protein
VRFNCGSGFSLLEILVVVALFAILFAMAFPVQQRAIAAAQRTQCTFNLRNIYTAIGSYAADYQGLVPSTRRVPLKGPSLNDTRYAGLVLLLEDGYIENAETLVCPSDKEPQRRKWEGEKSTKSYTSYFAYRDSFTELRDGKEWDRRLLEPDPNFGMKLPLMGDAAKSNFHVTGYNACFPDGHMEFLPPDANTRSPYRNINFFWE